MIAMVRWMSKIYPIVEWISRNTDIVPEQWEEMVDNMHAEFALDGPISTSRESVEMILAGAYGWPAKL
jgi:hypothetical protein